MCVHCTWKDRSGSSLCRAELALWRQIAKSASSSRMLWRGHSSSSLCVGSLDLLSTWEGLKVSCWGDSSVPAAIAILSNCPARAWVGGPTWDGLLLPLLSLFFLNLQSLFLDVSFWITIVIRREQTSRPPSLKNCLWNTGLAMYTQRHTDQTSAALLICSLEGRATLSGERQGSRPPNGSLAVLS